MSEKPLEKKPEPPAYDKKEAAKKSWAEFRKSAPDWAHVIAQFIGLE